MLEAVTPRTKLVYVCHPNNPTGTMNTKAELDAFFERMPERVLVVVDQAYFEYIDRPDYPDAVEAYVKQGRRVRRPAHVLEDLRARRARGSATRSARPTCVAAMTKTAPALRRHDDRAGRGACKSRRPAARSRGAGS